MAMLNFGVLPIKTAAEKKDYSFDWSKELEKDGDTIAGVSGDSNSTWSVAAGVTINTTDKPKTHDGRTASVWLNAGSTVGDYTLINTIVTVAGRTLVASATLKVVA